jgi:plastocyanin
MEETLFYVFGIALVVSALVLSAVGLRSEGFPPNRAVLVGVIGYFVVLVAATSVFAVLNAREEQRHRDAELAEAAATEEETSKPTTPGATATTEGPSGGAQGKATTLELAADTSAIAYDTTELSGSAGEVTIDFDNPSAIAHDVCLESGGEDLGCSETIAEGNASISQALEPGSYTFYCSVDGHRQSGMEGTLTIE